MHLMPVIMGRKVMKQRLKYDLDVDNMFRR